MPEAKTLSLKIYFTHLGHSQTIEKTLVEVRKLAADLDSQFGLEKNPLSDSDFDYSNEFFLKQKRLFDELIG
jgi:hypothetical protein